MNRKPQRIHLPVPRVLGKLSTCRLLADLLPHFSQIPHEIFTIPAKTWPDSIIWRCAVHSFATCRIYPCSSLAHPRLGICSLFDFNRAINSDLPLLRSSNPWSFLNTPLILVYMNGPLRLGRQHARLKFASTKSKSRGNDSFVTKCRSFWSSQCRCFKAWACLPEHTIEVSW